MSNSVSDSQQTATASENISNVLGSIGATGSATATGSGSGSASVTGSATESNSNSESASVSATQSVAASQSLTDAPSLGTASASASASASATVPQLSGAPKLTDLPTLSGYYSYPAPTVPPTQNAPYLQKTNLPENFIFIVVGACIAFVALLIISWRILTTWSINRRFRRHEGGNTGVKASYTPLADFKQKQPPVASSHDMKDLGTLPKNFSSVPSLFFSPTAEVARNSMRPGTGMSDTRGHLPAGHYKDASRA